MANGFQIIGIDHRPFELLFGLSDDELAEQSAQRCIASESFGYPCRISLQDAEVGEELLLLPYLHQPSASPYRASGPIFVRRGVQRRRVDVNEVPPYVARRLISLRAYDSRHMMVAASVCEGNLVASEIDQYFKMDDVSYLHLNNAKRGCFSCEVLRV